MKAALQAEGLYIQYDQATCPALTQLVLLLE